MVANNRFYPTPSIKADRFNPARNIAELVCDLGLLLRWRMRNQPVTQRTLLVRRSLRWDSELALRFVSLPVAVQFRAMVENWPVPRIQEVVQAQSYPGGRKSSSTSQV